MSETEILRLALWAVTAIWLGVWLAAMYQWRKARRQRDQAWDAINYFTEWASQERERIEAQIAADRQQWTSEDDSRRQWTSELHQQIARLAAVPEQQYKPGKYTPAALWYRAGEFESQAAAARWAAEDLGVEFEAARKGLAAELKRLARGGK